VFLSSDIHSRISLGYNGASTLSFTLRYVTNEAVTLQRIPDTRTTNTFNNALDRLMIFVMFDCSIYGMFYFKDVHNTWMLFI